MKTNKSLFVGGLVVIAVIAAGTVIGVNLTVATQNNPQIPMTMFLTDKNHGTTVTF